MTLKLFFHPLSSYCHKALIALYENATPFEPVLVDLGNPGEAAAFKALWPIGKFPVLKDEARDTLVPESSIIIEYLALHYPGPSQLIPADPDLAIQTRLRDRFYDQYLLEPVGKIVPDRLRPPGQNDHLGVEQARERLRTAYDMIEADMSAKPWAMGQTFTLADCAAAPALFYANMIEPFSPAHRNCAAYLERLKARPSYARTLDEAEPYFAMMPKG